MCSEPHTGKRFVKMKATKVMQREYIPDKRRLWEERQVERTETKYKQRKHFFFLGVALFGLNEKSQRHISLFRGERTEPTMLEWKRGRWATLNPPPPTHALLQTHSTCLPICHMPPYHQSTPKPRSWGLVIGRPCGASCQQFLAQDQISGRESGQPEVP
jgi:hypothetical protein